jgi:hypothetical protein
MLRLWPDRAYGRAAINDFNDYSEVMRAKDALHLMSSITIRSLDQGAAARSRGGARSLHGGRGEAHPADGPERGGQGTRAQSPAQ